MNREPVMAAFRAPSAAEAFFNRAFGFLVGLGIGPAYVQLLQIRGRKTGRLYSSPVNLLEFHGKPAEFAARLGCKRTHLSLSHTKEQAIAYVILED